MMQARWGTHGDHSMIALSPASVQECFDLTVQAFNLAEKYRTPVYLMADETIGHLRETVTIRTLDPSEIIDRKQPDKGISPLDFRPYQYDSIMPSAMPPFGSNQYQSRTTGSTHDERGEFRPTPENIHRVTHYLTDKIEKNADDICMTRSWYLDDAEIVFITYGCATRSALEAMDQLRTQGKKVGMLQMQTVWPLPEKEIRAVLSSAKTVVVPELNLGQIAGEIRKFNDYGCQVLQANRVDGILISPAEIMAVLKEAL